MNDLAQKYKIPDEIMAFVNKGVLVLLAEDEARKTVEFHVPSKRWTNPAGHITTYSVVWIHPDFNTEFCHYYVQKPGDMPNFHVQIDTDGSDDEVEDMDTVDDLAAWLDREIGEAL